MSWLPNALTVLERQYLKKDAQGNVVERPGDLFLRVAQTIAAESEKYGADAYEVKAQATNFYRAMTDGAFLPNSPCLMNAGRPLGQLSACFVLPIDDSIESIYRTLKDAAIIHKSGGGTGFSFSRLRPEGSMVQSTTGVASGPVSFLGLYNASTGAIKQGGTRRGANMAILSCDHEDIRKFIQCKADTSKVTNFNISVAATDTWMQAAMDGRNEDFELLVQQAWATGEPGLFFIDEANRFNPVPRLGGYEATNPCGEQPLLPYDVCNLGSVNLGLCVRDGEVDWLRLKRLVHLGVLFLDNVIDANRPPLEEIRDLAQQIRRIGLGVMGWADMLVRLRIPYDSWEAVALGEEVMGFVNEEARIASEKLATVRGAFPAWPKSIWGLDSTCARDAEGGRVREPRHLRHCNITTVAPTGSISIIAGCSSGIEPHFALSFQRRQAGTIMEEVNADYAHALENWPKDEVKRVFRTAHFIEPKWHLRHQLAFQRHVDSAVSKTINLPRDAKPEDVGKVFLDAWAGGAKGITVYRDGSRPGQVLTAS